MKNSSLNHDDYNYNLDNDDYNYKLDQDVFNNNYNNIEDNNNKSNTTNFILFKKVNLSCRYDSFFLIYTFKIKHYLDIIKLQKKY